MKISISTYGESSAYFSCWLNSSDWIDFTHAFQNNSSLDWEQAQTFLAWQNLHEKVRSHWCRGGLSSGWNSSLMTAVTTSWILKKLDLHTQVSNNGGFQQKINRLTNTFCAWWTVIAWEGQILMVKHSLTKKDLCHGYGDHYLTVFSKQQL